MCLLQFPTHTGSDGFFFVPSLPGDPGPGGPSSTPNLSTQDYFLLGACQPADSIHRSLGTASDKGKQHNLRERRRGCGSSLGLIHRCTPFKSSSYPLCGWILSSSLFLSQVGRSSLIECPCPTGRKGEIGGGDSWALGLTDLLSCREPPPATGGGHRKWLWVGLAVTASAPREWLGEGPCTGPLLVFLPLLLYGFGLD